MLKPTLQGSNEAIFASKVNGKPFMVATSFQNAEVIDANGEAHSCEGLLMRRFENSFFGIDFQWSVAFLPERCKAMIIAINSMHAEGIVHVDLKRGKYICEKWCLVCGRLRIMCQPR